MTTPPNLNSEDTPLSDIEVLMSRYVRKEQDMRLTQIENAELRKELLTKNEMVQKFSKKIVSLQDEVRKLKRELQDIEEYDEVRDEWGHRNDHTTKPE